MQVKNEGLSMAREGRMLAYSLAAGASAVAAGSADGAIVYSGLQNIPVGQYASQDLFIDGDPYTDIKLKNYVFGGGNYQGATVSGYPGQLVGFTTGLTYATALNAGDAIDAGTVGPSFFGGLAYGANNPDAQFNNATDAYIGLSFPIGGNAPQFLHYAWIRVDIDNASGTFVIKDWAYEDQAGVGIAAGAVPEPGALSLLAAGATGLLAMRRRKQA